MRDSERKGYKFILGYHDIGFEYFLIQRKGELRYCTNSNGDVYSLG
jgi:hypothetical protein